MKKFSNVIVLLTVAIIAIIAIAVMILSPSINHEIYDSVNNFGLAIHPIYSNFSSPESGFTINNNILSASDNAIYKIAYYSINGANWQNFTLSGTILSGNWLNNTATYTLPKFASGESYVLIYSCTKNISSWNCHDNKWQLQIVNNTNSSSTFSWSGELMINGGFEEGNLNGWTTSTGGWRVGNHLSNAEFVLPQKGNYQAYINGTSGVNGFIYQDVNLTDYASDIDAGKAFVNASGWGVSSESNDQDLSRIQIMFLNSTHGIITTAIDSDDVSSGIWWQKGIYNYPIPAGAKYIRMWGNTYEQGYSSGNLDSFSVKIGHGGSPVIPPSCTPSCAGKQCGSDGCTGTCGTCSNTHGTTSCSSSGSCQPVCNSNYASCDSNNVNGCETQLGTTSNCNSCGNVCSSGQTCTNNVCTNIPPSCTDTCSSLGYQCGIQTICGKNVNCGTCTVSGTTYYVSTGGSDSNNGLSSATAFKSLSHACDQVRTSGDLIHVMAGTYTENSQCNLAVGVSIEGEGANTIINTNYQGGESSGLISADSSSGNPVSGHQSISYLTINGQNQADTGIDVEFRSDVSIHHVKLQNFANFGIWIYNNNHGYPLPPTIAYATGNTIHDSTFINCELRFEGQSGFTYYNNIHTNSIGNVKCLTSEWMKTFIIHDNVFTKAFSSTGWDFYFETWHYSDNSEIYNNVFHGASTVDLSDIRRGNGQWGLKVYNNTFLRDSIGSGNDREGEALDFEGWGALQYIYVYDNYFKNVVSAIWVGGTNQQNCVYPDGKNWALDHIYVYYNIVDNEGVTDQPASSAIWFWDAVADGYSNNLVWDNIFVQNNVLTSTGTSTQNEHGIRLSLGGAATNFHIDNNIIRGYAWTPILFTSGTSINSISIQKNIFYQNGDNSITWGGTSSNQPENNLVNVNPSFKSSTDFHLNANSPAKDAGITVSWTKDYDGNSVPYPASGATDIGAYEYR